MKRKTCVATLVLAAAQVASLAAMSSWLLAPNALANTDEDRS